MGTINYETVIVIAGIIQLVLIILFVMLYFHVWKISKQCVKQTQIFIAIADKQGALIKQNCPGCKKEIIITLLDNKPAHQCEQCKAYFIIKNGVLTKTCLSRITCSECKNEIITYEPYEVHCPKCNTLNKLTQ